MGNKLYICTTWKVGGISDRTFYKDTVFDPLRFILKASLLALFYSIYLLV